MIISEKIRSLADEADKALSDLYASTDAIARTNTEHVLDVFREHRVSEAMFAPSTGYGYGDTGRDTTDQIIRDIFKAEEGFVRSSVISGTHALTIGLFALLRPGDTLLSVTGSPYDTLREVIGMDGKNGDGSLADFGVSYAEISMTPASTIDLPAVEEYLKTHKVKAVFLQRSKGYLDRRTLSVEEIGELVSVVRKTAPDTYVITDNCYGEFTDIKEPTSVGVDLMIGSLIKNPGGGMADTGAYLCGTKRAVELAGYRLSSPGVGLEAGASLGQTRNILKGLFYAPHTVAQALKTACFAAYIFEQLGYEVNPKPFEARYDIIQTIKFRDPQKLISFCKGIQSASPIDSHVTPEPWAMPGYADKVIMAAGAFTNGASIELSADGPLRDPYIAYLQGGLTFESGRLGIMRAADEIICNS